MKDLLWFMKESKKYVGCSSYFSLIFKYKALKVYPKFKKGCNIDREGGEFTEKTMSKKLIIWNPFK